MVLPNLCWLNQKKKMYMDKLLTINNNDSSLAVDPKPISNCESLPTQPYKQIWEATGQEKDKEEKTKKNKETKRT